MLRAVYIVWRNRLWVLPTD